MTLQGIVGIIERCIADEETIGVEYHDGRSSAFRFVLELLAELEADKGEETEQ